MNNVLRSHDVIVSGIHLELTPALKAYVAEKAERLFRHDDHILRIRVELEFDNRTAKEDKFTAKGHIKIKGPDMNVSVTSDDAYKSIDLLVDKLDRMIERASRWKKEKRNHPHEVELGVMLPKAV